ncbi:class F sortase [Streptomyces qaidamensis]|uniref:class F sortase n=1 Tax=Streptomyces qaidamensis TaxID=1783515 RepID=UPI00365CC22C
MVSDACLPADQDGRGSRLHAARGRSLLGPGRKARLSGHGPPAGLHDGSPPGRLRHGHRGPAHILRRGRLAGSLRHPHRPTPDSRVPHGHAPRPGARAPGPRAPGPDVNGSRTQGPPRRLRLRHPRTPQGQTRRAAKPSRGRHPAPRSSQARRPRPGRPEAPPPAGLRPLPRSLATRLLIPYLRVDAPVMGLGLDRDRRLTAPPDDDPKLVGWYRHGASPGEQGTAVAVGHLDTDRGPAVFAGLTELKRGRIVKARRADGRIAVYTVDKIKSYEKAHFPSQEVYGARGRPELRLITCGGSYDRRKGYSGNVVVFAHLTGIR